MYVILNFVCNTYGVK